jgi:hypothetical protein
MAHGGTAGLRKVRIIINLSGVACMVIGGTSLDNLNL